MNWEQVKKDCPEAFKYFMMPFLTVKLRENYGGLTFIPQPDKKVLFGSVILKSVIELPYWRRLYDFFDLHYIFVNVTPIDAQIVITDKDGKVLKNFMVVPTKPGRKNVEFEAFEKAFQELEIQIKAKINPEKV